MKRLICRVKGQTSKQNTDSLVRSENKKGKKVKYSIKENFLDYNFHFLASKWSETLT